ncbi:MAG: hypothetical protein H7Z76_07500 [Methylotenera sp.]|nr:hypothetical protein [Flavobacterium sp.]
MSISKESVSPQISKDNLIWFNKVMSQMRMLNKTLDLSYKPILTDKEESLFAFLGEELMSLQANKVKLPEELSVIVKEYYPYL